jgi:hypothetical protein
VSRNKKKTNCGNNHIYFCFGNFPQLNHSWCSQIPLLNWQLQWQNGTVDLELVWYSTLTQQQCTGSSPIFFADNSGFSNGIATVWQIDQGSL